MKPFAFCRKAPVSRDLRSKMSSFFGHAHRACKTEVLHLKSYFFTAKYIVAPEKKLDENKTEKSTVGGKPTDSRAGLRRRRATLLCHACDIQPEPKGGSDALGKRELFKIVWLKGDKMAS